MNGRLIRAIGIPKHAPMSVIDNTMPPTNPSDPATLSTTPHVNFSEPVIESLPFCGHALHADRN